MAPSKEDQQLEKFKGPLAIIKNGCYKAIYFNIVRRRKFVLPHIKENNI